MLSSVIDQLDFHLKDMVLMKPYLVPFVKSLNSLFFAMKESFLVRGKAMDFLIFVVDGKMDPFARTKKMYMKITMGVIRTILGLILLRY